MRMRNKVVGCLVLMALAGCGTDAAESHAVRVDTLPNGAIHVTNSGDGAWTESTAWRAVEILSLGGLDAEGPEQFAQTWAVTLDAGGRVYVLERQPQEVRVFDVATGEHVLTFGREGQGPGEFRLANGFAWDNDGRLWVSDPGNQRYSAFDAEGRPTETLRRRVSSYFAGCECAFATDGSLIQQGTARDPDDPEASYRTLLRTTYPTDGPPQDTVPIVRWVPETVEIEFPGGTMSLAPPFTVDIAVGLDGGRGVWWAEGSTYRLTRLDLEGNPTLVVEREVEPERVTAEEADAALAWLQGLLEDRGGTLPPDVYRSPEVKSFFTHLFTDDRGYLWVQRRVASEAFPRRGAEFDVFDPSGVFLGRLPVDVGIGPVPYVRGDLFVGVRRDELDVPEVVVFRIEGRE